MSTKIDKYLTHKPSLVHHTHQLLRTEIPKFDFEEQDRNQVFLFAQMLVDKMREHRGVGLSANQLGIPVRAFAMEGEPAFVCFNPVVTTFDPDTKSDLEGCLSYPGVGIRVKRPSTIRVRFQDYNGDVCVRVFTGLTARIFLHELDHLNGISFLKHVHSIHREKILKRLTINERRRRG